jgi:hypothetical protein
MSIEPETSTPEPLPGDATERRRNRRLVGGVMLILIGLMVLAGQFFPNAGLLFLPGLAILFLAWGLLTRKIGLIIPGGILSGIGAGAALIEGPFHYLPEQARGGVFLMTFAAGFVLIPLLAPFSRPAPRLVWWPLIPAFFIGGTGALLFAGQAGLNALQYANYAWPLVLVALGLYMILRRRDM